MKKIAIFGKPGGGKSTLGKKLSAKTGIAVFPLDLIEYDRQGERVSRADFMAAHEKLILGEEWIIDGLGYLEAFWQRVDAADTLVYVDLHYCTAYWWVTKRLLKSIFVKPEGWPEGSSVLKGSLAGWKHLRLSRKFWTPELFEEIRARGRGKQVYRITSVKQMNNFAELLSDQVQAR